MDLNQLYFDHQIALMRAAEGPLKAAQKHLEAAAGVARQIACFQRRLGAGAGRSYTGPCA
ncbi:MAG TPA: hypothetical protein VHG29_05220 [Novosphingobium sp.]|nr:hypothetical protein [Novosphingobium sp.]